MQDANQTGQASPPASVVADGHVKDRRTLFAIIFAMLCVLTALSFWVSHSYLMLTPLTGWTIMMAISIAKAMLVILFFMHLWWEKAWKYVLTVPAVIIGVVLVLLLIPDVGNRFEAYSKTRRSDAPEPYFGSTSPVTETSILRVPKIP